MKNLKLINILHISFFIFALLALPAMADTHALTGNLTNDWGVNLTKAYAEDAAKPTTDNDAWIPKGSDVQFIVENNIDTQWNANSPMFGWAGSTYGTHMQRNATSSAITHYNEPLIYCTNQGTYYVQPAGGEAYDIEALYFDSDPKNVYLAIVSSMPESGVSDGTNTWKMGDIGFDINNSVGTVVDENGKTIDTTEYEYGIKVLTGQDENGKDIKNGSIIYKPIWDTPRKDEFPTDYPYTIKGGIFNGTVNKIIYTSYNVPPDNGKPNSIIEVSIPRIAIGSPSKDQLSKLHLTIGCGNDLIELSPVRFNNSIPEFPSVVLPVVAVLSIMLIIGRRKKE